jgi:hypothetical protein
VQKFRRSRLLRLSEVDRDNLDNVAIGDVILNTNAGALQVATQVNPPVWTSL